MRLDGMNVISSVLAVSLSPRRVHRAKRWMSAAYHRRVQKKWVKRWGHTEKPAAYRMTNPITGAHEIVMHPDLIANIKATAKPFKPPQKGTAA